MWHLVVSAGLLAPHLGLLAFTRALRSYSRRRLEERCEARGFSELLVDEIAHLDERTAQASEMLFLLTGVVLAIAFGDMLLSAEYSGTMRVSFILVTLGIGLTYVLTAICGSVFAEAVIESLWPIAGSIRALALPFTFAARQVERFIVFLAGAEEASARPASVEVEVPAESEEESDDLEAELPDKARELLEQAVTLTRTDVSEIMTPRSEITSLPATVSAKDAARVFRDTGKSRIPIYGENRDDVVGILYAKDLFPMMTDPDRSTPVVPAELVRPPFFVPESKNAFELLEEFRAKRTQLAMILDEYGGVSGLITLEDLLEELVGIIDDEHDVPTPDDPIRQLGESRYEVDASLSIEELNERLQLRFPTDEGFQTAAGLALHSLGRLPALGDSFRVDQAELTVAEVADHTVRRLIIDLNPAADGDSRA